MCLYSDLSGSNFAWCRYSGSASPWDSMGGHGCSVKGWRQGLLGSLKRAGSPTSLLTLSWRWAQSFIAQRWSHCTLRLDTLSGHTVCLLLVPSWFPQALQAGAGKANPHWHHSIMCVCKYVCICMCACVYVCTCVNTCVWMCAWMCIMHVCGCVCVCLCVHVYMCVSMCAWMCVCVYVRVCMCGCMCVRLCVCVCVLILVCPTISSNAQWRRRDLIKASMLLLI